MMKNKNLFYGIIALLFLVVLSVFVWNNYQIQGQERPIQNSGRCVMENCHGLDITCGPNLPDACPEIYMAGDNCRRYAGCQSIEGQCILEKAPKFDSCKSCVEKCEIDFKDEQIEFLQCESRCAE